ncbi:MAG: hypothetical protein AB7V13_19505 [Pseudorhodoplanes sp.]
MLATLTLAMPVAMPAPAADYTPEQICVALTRQTLAEPSDFQLVAPKVTLAPGNRAKAADGRLRIEVPFRDRTKGIKIGTCVFKDGPWPDFMAVGARHFSKAEIEELGRHLEAGR